MYEIPVIMYDIPMIMYNIPMIMYRGMNSRMEAILYSIHKFRNPYPVNE